MREILFKGKDIKGNWYEGLLSHNVAKDEWYISNKAGIATAYQVRPETIGQYTGLIDKTGRKIFEGDIIQYDGDYDGLDGFTRSFSEKAIVLWDEDYCGFVCKVIGDESGDRYSWLEYRENPDLTIIGNIYDNPELIGGD